MVSVRERTLRRLLEARAALGRAPDGRPDALGTALAAFAAARGLRGLSEPRLVRIALREAAAQGPLRAEPEDPAPAREPLPRRRRRVPWGG